MHYLPQPTLSQLQYYIKTKRKELLSNINEVDEIKILIKSFGFKPDLPIERAFFFGYQVDKLGEPIIEIESF